MHQLSCQKFADLVRADPDRALPPAAEYERWQAEDKAGEREDRIAAKVADTDERRRKMAGRFRTIDILED